MKKLYETDSDGNFMLYELSDGSIVWEDKIGFRHVSGCTCNIKEGKDGGCDVCKAFRLIE